MGPACIILVVLLCINVCDIGVEASENETENKEVQPLFENSLQESRGKKKKNRIMQAIIVVKMLALSVLIPSTIALALLGSWKGVTISLIAFTIALFAGIKNNGKPWGDEKSLLEHHVVVPHMYDEHWHKYAKR